MKRESGTKAAGQSQRVNEEALQKLKKQKRQKSGSTERSEARWRRGAVEELNRG